MEKIENKLALEEFSSSRTLARCATSTTLPADEVSRLLAFFEVLASWDKDKPLEPRN